MSTDVLITTKDLGRRGNSRMAPSGARGELGGWHQRQMLGYWGDHHVHHYPLVEPRDSLDEVVLVSRGQPPFETSGLEISGAHHLAFSRKSQSIGRR